jgi:hypothetical protein
VGRSYGTATNPDQARPDAVATLYTDILRESGYRSSTRNNPTAACDMRRS